MRPCAGWSLSGTCRFCRKRDLFLIPFAVGIPGPDEFHIKHSTARRKGLTIRMSRRMKHVYPRAIKLAESGAVDLTGIVSHHYPLARTPEAYAMNVDYQDEVVKIIIDV